MGQSRNWVLLRGLARGKGHWGSFADKIRERFPHDHFELLDLPGNGTRCKETSPLKVSEFVSQIRSQCEAVQRGEKIHLLAISLGGMIAVEWMREYPHDVEKAYLICTSAGNFSPVHARFLLPNYLAASKLAAYAGDPAKWESTVLGMVANNQERRDAEFLQMVAFSQENPMQRRNVIRQLMAASRYKFPEQPPGDIQLLGSHGDHLVSPQCTLDIAQRWGLKAKMHPWAGHDVPVDDPDWVLEQLL